MPLLDELLGVVPGAAGVGHVDGEQHACDEGAREQAAQRGGAEQNADQQRREDGDQAGDDHLLEGGLGGDGDAGLVVGPRLPLQDAGDLPELAAHLGDHLVGRLRDGVHRERGEGEGQHAAQQQADDHIGREDIDARQLHLLGIGYEERKRGQRGGSDGEALAHGRGGIAHCVQLVGDLAHVRVEAGHLRDAAGVVGDGAVGVYGYGNARRGQHADRRQRDAVEVIGDLVGDEDADADQQRRHPGAHHADSHAADDGGGGAGLRLVGDGLDGAIVLRGVDLGDIADDEADDEAGNDSQRVIGAAEENTAEYIGRHGDHTGGHIGAHFERLVGIGVVLAADEEGGNDGSDDADRRDRQREKRACAGEAAGLQRDAEGQRGDQRADIALKEVGAHARHIAHVVAHIIRDDGRVARVVLGDAGLDLADEVRAYVGRLGVDAAADTREQRDGGCAEREAEEDLIVAGDDIDEAAAEQTEADDAHAHHAAAGEGDGQRLVHAALLRGISGADIRARRDIHAEEAREDGEERTEQEADRGADVDKDRDQHKQHDNEDRQDLVLRDKEGMRALGNRRGDFLHFPRAGILPADKMRLIGGKQQRAGGKHGNDPG